MRVVFLFLLVGVNFIQAVDRLRKNLKSKWQNHDKKQEDHRNYLANLPPKARCLKIVGEQIGISNYPMYQTERSMAYVDMMQECEAFLVPRESSHLKQTNRKFNEHLKITGYHNIYENNGSIQVFRNMEDEDKIKWEDPNNFMFNDTKETFENCLRLPALPEHLRANYILDEVPKWWAGPTDVREFGRKVLLSLLNKVSGGKIVPRGGIFIAGGPVENVEVTRKESCISYLLKHFGPTTENEALEYMSNIIQILIKENMLDKILLPGYYTALTFAAQTNQMRVMEMLLEANANVDAADYFGATALTYAASLCNLDMMNILLKNNANVNIHNKSDMSPLMRVASYGGENHLEIVNVLLEAGADIDLQNSSGETALMWASAFGNLELVKKLLEKNARVNIRDNKEGTALMKATENGRINTMKVLLTWNAETDVQGKNGITALMLAAASGNLEAVKLLLNKNANAKITGSGEFEGLTAAAVAKRNGHDEVAQAIDQFNN